MFEKQVVVRFGECDGLGHVNNGTYFTYFEDARMDVFRLFVPSLDLKRWNLIVASTRCDFLQQATYSDTLKIDTWIGNIGNSSFVVEHAITDRAGRFVARGQAVLLAYDYTAGTPMSLWPEVRKALSEHQDAPHDAPELRA